MAQFDTVANIVGDVGTELGLGTLTASYTSSDPNVLQLLKLLKSTGRQLILEHPWLQNVVSYTFTTTATTTFQLPTDFLSMVDGTCWNRTTRQPLVPVSPQQWEALKASGTSSTLTVLLRPVYSVDAGPTGIYTTLEFLNTATAGQTIAFQYRSRYWAGTTVNYLLSLDAPTATSHLVFLDSLLITRALKLAFLRNKGYPSEAAQQDFEATLESCRSANAVVAPVLSLASRRESNLLTELNVPETGYGS